VLLGGHLGLLAHRVGFAAGGRQLALRLAAQRLDRAAATAHDDGGEHSPDDESQ